MGGDVAGPIILRSVSSMPLAGVGYLPLPVLTDDGKKVLYEQAG